MLIANGRGQCVGGRSGGWEIDKAEDSLQVVLQVGIMKKGRICGWTPGIHRQRTCLGVGVPTHCLVFVLAYGDWETIKAAENPIRDQQRFAELGVWLALEWLAGVTDFCGWNKKDSPHVSIHPHQEISRLFAPNYIYIFGKCSPEAIACRTGYPACGRGGEVQSPRTCWSRPFLKKSAKGGGRQRRDGRARTNQRITSE